MLTRSNKGPKLRKLKKKSRRKRKKGDTKDNKTDKADRKIVAPMQLELISLQLQPQAEVAKKREKLEIYPRSPIIVIIKKASMPPSASSQKTSYSFSYFYTGDC